jgi:hypothetical protein
MGSDSNREGKERAGDRPVEDKENRVMGIKSRQKRLKWSAVDAAIRRYAMREQFVPHLTYGDKELEDRRDKRWDFFRIAENDQKLVHKHWQRFRFQVGHFPALLPIEVTKSVKPVKKLTGVLS